MKTKITGIKKKSVFTDTKIASAIQNTEEVEIDALWAILKYKEPWLVWIMTHVSNRINMNQCRNTSNNYQHH